MTRGTALSRRFAPATSARQFGNSSLVGFTSRHKWHELSALGNDLDRRRLACA
jgi:hypothetical protein